jgi:hypothetical protein
MYFINHTRRYIVRTEAACIFFTIKELIDRIGWSLKDNVDLVMELDSKRIHEMGYRVDTQLY